MLVGVSTADPQPEGQLVGLLSQGMTTHTVFASSDELPALSQTDVSHLSDVLPPAHDAVTRRWSGHLLILCDLNESLKTGNKNGYSNEAAEGI